MNPAELQDRIHRGLNAAARAVGADTDAYRPSGSAESSAQRNRYLRLRAAFTGQDGKFARPNAYGDALWHGLFDAAYTRVGDYLVQQGSIWFIAAQQRLLPVLCVQTNRIVCILAPGCTIEYRRECLRWRYGHHQRDPAGKLAGERARCIGARALPIPVCRVIAPFLLDRPATGDNRCDTPSIGSNDLMTWGETRSLQRRADRSWVAYRRETGDDLMADQSDVEDALVTVVSAALYPTGTDDTSVPGPDCRIYRGWPNSAALDADLAAGKINVTVFPIGATGRTTTRYSEQWMGACAPDTDGCGRRHVSDIRRRR